MDSTARPARATIATIATSPARARLQERVRLLQQPEAAPREHVGGRVTALRWSGLAAL